MAESLSSPHSHGNEEHSQVEVCTFCGDRGFLNALINCSECCETLVHQYCLGITPGSIDDGFNWLCEFCCARMESEPCSSTKSVCASTKGKGKTKKRKRERVPSLPQSEIPLLGSRCKRIRKERIEESLSGTAKVPKGNCSDSADVQNLDSLLNRRMDCRSSCTVYCDDNVDEAPHDEGESAIIPVVDQPEPLLTVLPVEYHQISEEEVITKYGSHLLDCLDQPEPLLTVLPVEYHQSSEEEVITKYGSHLLDCREEPEGTVSSLMENPEPEGAVSSLMENPEELMRGVVLLVSPSGEVFIHENSGLCDEASGIVLLVSPSGEVFIHGDSSLCDEASGRIFKQGGPCKLTLESRPTVGEMHH